MILKFLAIVLSALSLVATVAGTMGIVAMENAGLYVRGLDELQDQQCEVIAATVAKSFAQCHAVDSYGNLRYLLRRDLYSDPEERADAEFWRIRLEQGGEVLVDPGDVSDFSMSWEYTMEVHYPIASWMRPSELNADETTQTTAPAAASSYAAGSH